MDFLRRLALVSLVIAAPLAARAQSTVPTLTQAIPAQTLSASGAPVTVDLSKYFSLPGVTGQVAQVDTTLGKFNVELLSDAAPKNVQNFLAYVNAGLYQNMMVHRSVANFVIQTGGYPAVLPPAHLTTFAAVQNEFKLSNLRGTLAMAKLGNDPNSATSEWFVNLADNSANLDSQNGGFTVFARVLGTGMTVVDAIAAVPTYNAGSPFDTIPLQNVQSGQTNIAVTNLITINSVTVIPVFPSSNTASAVFSFAVVNNNSAAVTATLNGSTLTITPVAAGAATLSIRAADTNNNFTSTTISVTVATGNSAPAITVQPVSQNVATGSTAVFNVAASGVPTPTYQWQFNGSAIAGATGPRLVLAGGTAQAGTYSVVVTNSLGSVTSNNAALAFTTTTDVGRLTNLSVLADLSFDDPSFTVGAVIGGGAATATKPLLVREVGPSLASVGVASGFLADPIFSLADGTSKVIGGNDDWGGDSTLASTFARFGAFAFASATSKDAALYNPGLAPGNYTVIVGSKDRSAGKVLAEIYDATPAATFGTGTPRLLDISVLKNIATGGSVTAGFVIGGNTSRTVLIRAIGPGLAALGVGGAMADPLVELFDGSSKKIFDNDNWGGDPQLTAANAKVGAFAIANLTSKDAIMLVTLTPGNYTARVTGVGGAAGLAVVEVYDVP